MLSYFESFNTGGLSGQHLCFGHDDDIKPKFPQAGFPWVSKEQLAPPEMSTAEHATHAHKLPPSDLGQEPRLIKVPAALNQCCTSKPVNMHSEQHTPSFCNGPCGP